MTNPTNPFTELNRFFERMQSDFEEMVHSWSDETEFVSSSVRVDPEDRDDEFVLTAELPEFEKDDISTAFNNGILTVRLPKSEPVTQGKQIEILALSHSFSRLPSRTTRTSNSPT